MSRFASTRTVRAAVATVWAVVVVTALYLLGLEVYIHATDYVYWQGIRSMLVRPCYATPGNGVICAAGGLAEIALYSMSIAVAPVVCWVATYLRTIASVVAAVVAAFVAGILVHLSPFAEGFYGAAKLLIDASGRLLDTNEIVVFPNAIVIEVAIVWFVTYWFVASVQRWFKITRADSSRPMSSVRIKVTGLNVAVFAIVASLMFAGSDAAASNVSPAIRSLDAVTGVLDTAHTAGLHVLEARDGRSISATTICKFRHSISDWEVPETGLTC